MIYIFLGYLLWYVVSRSAFRISLIGDNHYSGWALFIMFLIPIFGDIALTWMIISGLLNP